MSKAQVKKQKTNKNKKTANNVHMLKVIKTL